MTKRELLKLQHAFYIVHNVHVLFRAGNPSRACTCLPFSRIVSQGPRTPFIGAARAAGRHGLKSRVRQTDGRGRRVAEPVNRHRRRRHRIPLAAVCPPDRHRHRSFLPLPVRPAHLLLLLKVPVKANWSALQLMIAVRSHGTEGEGGKPVGAGRTN